MNRQRGVALIIALLLVALGTLVVASLIEQNQLAVARTRNLLREQQAYAYARGLEAYAFEVLRRDSAEGTGFDSTGDLWATPMPPVDVPGGRLAGRMRDLNGCLNLNALVRNDVPNPVQLVRMQRLLRILKLNPELVEAIIDWTDSNTTPEARGAEDLSYLLLDPPYRAANAPFRHVSELRLVKGFDEDAYRAIEPHVCAASPGARTNVNTASETVLRTLVEGMSEASAQRLYNGGRARHRSVEDLRAVFEQEHLPPLTPAEEEGLSVVSTWFLAESMIEIDGIPLNYFSVIEREAGNLRVVARSRGLF
jgi:general secretion pathway protein K